MEKVKLGGLVYEFEDGMALMALLDENADRVYESTETSPDTPLTLEELLEIVQQLERCGYECEGGPLNMNKAFVRLKELAYRHKPEEG